MWARVSATMVAAGLLVGCAQDDPTLEEVLADAVIDDAEAAATATDGTAADPVSDNEDVADGLVGEDSAEVDARADDAVEVADDEEAEDPFAVPEVINEEYASLVINELLAILSESLRAVLADQDPGGVRAEAVHRELYGLPILEARLSSLQQSFVSVEGRETQLPPESFGRQRFELLQLVSIEEGCVTAYGHYDVSATSRFPFPEDAVAAFVINSNDPVDSELNPVGWRLWDVTGLVSGGELVPVDELDEVAGLDSVLDTNCDGARGVG